MTSQNPVSSFLEQKWRQAFAFFDVNKDGLLTTEKFREIADYISKTTNASDEEASKTREEWMKWIRFFQPDPSVKIDAERYVATFAELYQDIDEFKRISRATSSDLFDKIDLNKDGLISLEEFNIFYRACGRTDKELAVENFSKIDKNDDGYIQREEFIDDGLRFYTDPDPVSGKAYLTALPGWDQL